MSFHIDIINNGGGVASFNLSVNGNELFTDNLDIIAEIEATAAFQERGFAYAAWDWLISNRYHTDPYTGAYWQHDPSLYLNSIGFGYCGEVASVYWSLVTSYGYEARVWAIGEPWDGHIVGEVLNNGRWELYDVDMEVLYVDAEGNIAGYDYIANSDDDFHANLLNSDYAQDVNPPNPVVYEDWFLDAYYKTEDDFVADFYMLEQPDFTGETLIELPSGSFATIRPLDNLYTMYDSLVPRAASLEVHFGALDSFEFRYPLVPIMISGEGEVSIDGLVYEIGSIELNARLGDRNAPIYSILADTTGSDNSITYLINAARYSLDGAIDVELVDLVGQVDLEVGANDNPNNEPATIVGDTAGEVQEAGGVSNGTPGVPVGTGDLDSDDADNPDDWWQAVAPGAATANDFGTYGLSATGVWFYTLDDTNAAVQALQGTDTLSDSFTATTADGTAQLVTITIHAQNDAASITGATTGNVTEAGGAGNGNPGTPMASADLNATDPDNTNDTWTAVAARHCHRRRFRHLPGDDDRGLDLHARRHERGRAGAARHRHAFRLVHGDDGGWHRPAGDDHHPRAERRREHHRRDHRQRDGGRRGWQRQPRHADGERRPQRHRSGQH